MIKGDFGWLTRSRTVKQSVSGLQLRCVMWENSRKLGVVIFGSVGVGSVGLIEITLNLSEKIFLLLFSFIRLLLKLFCQRNREEADAQVGILPTDRPMNKFALRCYFLPELVCAAVAGFHLFC